MMIIRFYKDKKQEGESRQLYRFAWWPIIIPDYGIIWGELYKQWQKCVNGKWVNTTRIRLKKFDQL